MTGVLHRPAELSSSHRDGMVKLLEAHFIGVTRALFEADLADKDWVLSLMDGHGALRGFTTLAVRTLTVHGEPILAIYSGDTIVERSAWGTPALPRAWIRSVLSLAAAQGGQRRVYWQLICSGWRTYRFLPLFFHDYAPHVSRPTRADQQALLDRLALERYGPLFDAPSGIVRFPHPALLQEGVGDVTAERLRDPDIAFFAARNPGHAAGDELVCLTEIHADNMTPALLRLAGLARKALVLNAS